MNSNQAPQNSAEESNALFITRKQAATRYGISLRTVDELLHDGVLPRLKLSSKLLRIPVEAADQALFGLVMGGKK